MQKIILKKKWKVIGKEIKIENNKIFYTKVNTDYSITFPKQLRAKLNEMNNVCIYILRNNYIFLYFAVYSQPLAEDR